MEKSKLWGQKRDQWWPGSESGEKRLAAKVQVRILGGVACVQYLSCSGGYKTVHICQNPQNSNHKKMNYTVLQTQWVET